jgi:hypothetical protein
MTDLKKKQEFVLVKERVDTAGIIHHKIKYFWWKVINQSNITFLHVQEQTEMCDKVISINTDIHYNYFSRYVWTTNMIQYDVKYCTKWKTLYLHPTATQELVMTTRLTDLAWTHALRMAWVPSTAGCTISFSSFGLVAGKGLATCITFLMSLTALQTIKKNCDQSKLGLNQYQ